MGSHNHNKAITHLAMPERRIPVLIDSSPEKAEGLVPSAVQSGKPATAVRRLDPSVVRNLGNPKQRREIEREHGVINEADWSRLREFFSLLDRLNAGDLSPVITSNAEETLKELPALLDRLSPGGWLPEEEATRTGKLSFRPASDGRRNRARVTIDIATVSCTPLVGAPSVHQSSPRRVDTAAEDGDGTAAWSTTIRGACKTVAFAVSEALTEGLSKARFVVWWTDVAKKLVPGLYCPDIVTALYASAIWSYGTSGGWAICQKCDKDFARRRAKQFYCSNRCQAAAAMRRYRSNRKRTAEPKLKATTRGLSSRFGSNL